LSYPIAVYGRDGTIAGANWQFRNFTGITADEIKSGSANFFNCLIENNVALLEAVHNAFAGEEKVYEDMGPALRAKPGTSEYMQIADFPNAIFFPMAFDKDGVKLAAVLLDKNKKKTTLEEDLVAYEKLTKEPRAEQVKKKNIRLKARNWLAIAAACVVVAIIGIIAFYLNSKPPGIELPDNPVPLAGSPFVQPDENAKPYTGEEKGVAIPDIRDVTIPADTTDVKMLLHNPEGNPYNFTFEIVLADTEETLFKSGLVKPGMCIEDIALDRGLAQGEYKAILKISYYEPGDITAAGGVDIDFTLIAELG